MWRKKIRRSLYLLLAALMALTVAISACGSAATESPAADEEAEVVKFEEQTLTIAGSTTVLPILEKAAEAFMNANPNVVVVISAAINDVIIDIVLSVGRIIAETAIFGLHLV